MVPLASISRAKYYRVGIWHPTMPPPGSSRPCTRGINRAYPTTKSKRLTNSLVGGGHEGGSGSNEEGEEEEGTHLDSGVGFGCSLFAWLTCFFTMGKGRW